MDRFDAMRVFTRIVERRSFTRAADDLGLPRATVTDAIKALETRLGVRLLERTTRQVRPTLEGEAFYTRCLRLIADVEDTEAAFRDVAPRGSLRIEIGGPLARRWLFPKLPDFMARHPGIELDISEGDQFVDLVREGADCAIRVGTLRDSDLVARRLTRLSEITAASPAYCAQYGVPADVDTLEAEGHVMVGYRSSSLGALLPLEFQRDGQVQTVTLPTRVRVDGVDAYVGAACAGLGLFQAPRYGLVEHLASGRLVPVLEASPPVPSPVWLVHARGRLPSPRLRAFADWAIHALCEPPEADAAAAGAVTAA